MLHISADTRYRLFVNGTPASFGPCKSYPTRWYYDTVEIASLLRTGVNILAVKVLRLSPENPAATSIMRTSKPGLILHCKVGVRSVYSSLKAETLYKWSTWQPDSVLEPVGHRNRFR